jgi:hypothetical protein
VLACVGFVGESGQAASSAKIAQAAVPGVFAGPARDDNLVAIQQG